jgi:hypothetical protein
MTGSPGDGGQLFAGLLSDADSAAAAGVDNGFKARVVPFAGNKHLVEATPSGTQGFLDRMQAVENFHEGSVKLWLAFQRLPEARPGWEAMTPVQRRRHLLGIHYYQTAEARERRAAKVVEEALRVARRGNDGDTN